MKEGEFRPVKVNDWTVCAFNNSRLCKNRKLDSKLRPEVKADVHILGVAADLKFLFQWVAPGTRIWKKTAGATSAAISSFAPGSAVFSSECYDYTSVVGWFAEVMQRHQQQYQPHLFDGHSRDFVFPPGTHNTTFTCCRKRMETTLSRARVPSFNRNSAEGRSTKGDGSRDLYNSHTDYGALKCALLLNLPPLMKDWSDEVPYYPGEKVREALFLHRCRFRADGTCIPVELKRAMVGNPMADLSLSQLSPPDRNQLPCRRPAITIPEACSSETAINIATAGNDENADPNSGYDSDAPISTWAGKRAATTVHGNVYNGPVTIHLHVGSSKKPRTGNRNHDPEIAAYLAAISGGSK